MAIDEHKIPSLMESLRKLVNSEWFKIQDPRLKRNIIDYPPVCIYDVDGLPCTVREYFLELCDMHVMGQDPSGRRKVTKIYPNVPYEMLMPIDFDPTVLKEEFKPTVHA